MVRTTMASFEDKFYRRNPSRLERWRRDLALLGESAAFLALWATKGRRLRRAVRRAERRGEQVVIDGLGGPGRR